MDDSGRGRCWSLGLRVQVKGGPILPTFLLTLLLLCWVREGFWLHLVVFGATPCSVLREPLRAMNETRVNSMFGTAPSLQGTQDLISNTLLPPSWH